MNIIDKKVSYAKRNISVYARKKEKWKSIHWKLRYSEIKVKYIYNVTLISLYLNFQWMDIFPFS